MELRCECLEAVSGIGGASFPLSFLRQKGLLPLDWRAALSLENMATPSPLALALEARIYAGGLPVFVLMYCI